MGGLRLVAAALLGKVARGWGRPEWRWSRAARAELGAGSPHCGDVTTLGLPSQPHNPGLKTTELYHLAAWSQKSAIGVSVGLVPSGVSRGGSGHISPSASGSSRQTLVFLGVQTVPEPRPLLSIALSLGACPNLTFSQDSLSPTLPQDGLVFPGFQRQSHAQVWG